MLKTIFILCTIVMVYGSYEEEHEQHHEPQPYHFGYEVKDKHGTQYRQEKGDGHGLVEGSYGYTDEKGIYREVHYVADKSGFRAKVKTNEPGTKSSEPADAELLSSAKHEEEYYGQEAGNSYNSDYRRSDSPVVTRRKGEHGGHE